MPCKQDAALAITLVGLWVAGVHGFRGAGSPVMRRTPCAMAAEPGTACSLHDTTSAYTHTRSLFLRRTVFTIAAGAARPAGCVAAAPMQSRAPKFIDVAIDLGLGDDKILNVHQPYGLPKESKEDREGGGDRQGTYVWPASTDLAKFLVSEPGRKIVRSKRVVELGAGTAISGLAAALAGATWVAFTDGSPEVLQVTRDTVERNGLRVEGSAQRGLVQRLRWGNRQVFTFAIYIVRSTSCIVSTSCVGMSSRWQPIVFEALSLPVLDTGSSV